MREADGEIPLAASESVGVPKSVYKNCKNSKVVPYYSDNDLLQSKFVAYYSVADWPVYVLGTPSSGGGSLAFKVLPDGYNTETILPLLLTLFRNDTGQTLSSRLGISTFQTA